MGRAIFTALYRLPLFAIGRSFAASCCELIQGLVLIGAPDCACRACRGRGVKGRWRSTLSLYLRQPSIPWKPFLMACLAVSCDCVVVWLLQLLSIWLAIHCSGVDCWCALLLRTNVQQTASGCCDEGNEQCTCVWYIEHEKSRCVVIGFPCCSFPVPSCARQQYYCCSKNIDNYFGISVVVKSTGD